MKLLCLIIFLGFCLLSFAEDALPQEQPEFHRDAEETSDHTLSEEDFRRIRESLGDVIMKEGDLLCAQLEIRVARLEDLTHKQRALIEALEAELVREREAN